MRRLHRSALCGLALLAGSAAFSFEPVILSDFTSQGEFRVGTARTSLWNVAFAQTPDSVVLENVRITFGTSTFDAARIEISGLTSSRADLDALSSATSSETFATRLARISAKQILVPELKTTQTIGSERQTAIYKNVVLRDILQGKIAEAVAGSAIAEHAQGRASYGLIAFDRVDLPAIARLHETETVPEPNPLVSLYGGFSVENMDFADDKRGVRLTIAKVSGRDCRGRMISGSWSQAGTLFNELNSKNDLTSGELDRLFAQATDFLGAFDFGLVEATGIEINTTPPFAETRTKIARLSYSGATESKSSEAQIEGVEFTDQDQKFSLASGSVTGFSIAPTLEGLRKQLGTSVNKWDIVSLLPKLETLKLSGIAIDPLSNSHGAPRTQPRAAMDALEFTASEPIDNIPTNLRWAVKNLTVALPEQSDDDGVKELLALGYRDLDVSFISASRWNQTTGELASELSFQGKDMATIAATGVLGSVSKDFFNNDEAVSMPALLRTKVKTFDIKLKNDGLFERFLAKTAAEENTTPEKLRQTYGEQATQIVPSFVGTSDQASLITRAVARLIENSGGLSITARAKDPSGLDILSLSDPKAAMEKLDVTATAE